MGRYLLNINHYNSIRTPQKSTFSPVVCEAMHVCVVCFVGYLIWYFFWRNGPNFGMHRMKITAKRNVSRSQKIDLKLFLRKQAGHCHWSIVTAVIIVISSLVILIYTPTYSPTTYFIFLGVFSRKRKKHVLTSFSILLLLLSLLSV